MSFGLLRREIERRFESLWSYVLDQEEHITTLGERIMTATDDLAARLNAATNELAADLEALRDEVAGSDAAIAAKFEPLVNRLEGMGADPADPVPAPEPVNPGVPEGETDVVNPTPGAADNPDS
jgi:hypothetical protein